MQLLFQDSQLVAEASRAGTKAGDAAGASASKSMGQRLKANIGGLVSSGIGATLGLGFAVATRAASELDDASQTLIADTGLVGAAADEAKGQLASMYKGNLQGFDQIGAALAKVHTDLGLTGQAAGDATDLFLKFSTATGQDAAEAVTQADDTLDAWNLTAADAGSLLDKLIVSHQRYGGSISESQRALSSIAPALQGFGLKIDDGIALLNLFNAAGVDASKMPLALNTALKKAKSPAEFKKMLKDIADTKDPFEAAQKAATLFGARAGPQLAQALRQGNLDQFVVTMEDAAGATDKAADASLSWGDRMTLALHNIAGPLAEFGQSFGPLLMVGAQIGPKFAAVIATSIGGLASFVPGIIKSALGKLGVKLGLGLATTMGAEIAGQAGATAIAGGVTAAGSSAAVTGAASTIGGAIAATMAAALTAALVIGLGVAIALALDKAFPGLAKNIHDWFFAGAKAALGALTGNPLTPDKNYKAPTPGAQVPKGTGAAGPGPTTHTPTVNPQTGFVTGHAFGGSVSAMSPTWVGEHGQPELFVPRASGTIIPLDKGPQQSGGSTTINVPITGLIKARDPFEVATQLRRLASFGVLTPKAEPA